MHFLSIADTPIKDTISIQFTPTHSYAKKLYLHMFDLVDTVFSYESELFVCSFLQDFSMGKGSSLQLICNAHAAFFLCVAEIDWLQFGL